MENLEIVDPEMLAYNTVPLYFESDETELMWLCGRLEIVKERMRQRNEELKEAIKTGGISPLEPYPDFLEAERLSYLVINESNRDLLEQ